MKLSSVRSEWPEIYAWPTRLDGEPAPLRCNMCSKRGTRALARARQHMVSRGRKYRREIEASRVRRAYRGQTRKRTVVCRASHGRERHLTFDDSHWEILSRREREREREKECGQSITSARSISHAIHRRRQPWLLHLWYTVANKYIFIEFTHPNTVRPDYRCDLADARSSVPATRPCSAFSRTAATTSRSFHAPPRTRPLLAFNSFSAA